MEGGTLPRTGCGGHPLWLANTLLFRSCSDDDFNDPRIRPGTEWARDREAELWQWKVEPTSCLLAEGPSALTRGWNGQLFHVCSPSVSHGPLFFPHQTEYRCCFPPHLTALPITGPYLRVLVGNDGSPGSELCSHVRHDSPSARTPSKLLDVHREGCVDSGLIVHSPSASVRVHAEELRDGERHRRRDLPGDACLAASTPLSAS